MTFRSLMLRAAVVCLASVLASCAPSSPPGVDLVPIWFSINTDVDETKAFCDLRNETLRIHILNRGRKDAPPTKVRVTFAISGGKYAVTMGSPEVRANSINNFELAVPRACYKPDCSFEILADANNNVAEYDESNNLAYGLCEK